MYRKGPYVKGTQSRRCVTKAREVCAHGERHKNDSFRCPRPPKRTLCPHKDTQDRTCNRPNPVRKAIDPKFGSTRRSNTLKASRAVHKGQVLFCEDLELLFGEDAIDAYEDEIHELYGDKYQFPVVVRTHASEGRVGLRLIHVDERRDPRTLFYMMNHGATAGERNVTQTGNIPFQSDPNLSKVPRTHTSLQVSVCAKRAIPKGQDILWDYGKESVKSFMHGKKWIEG